MKRPNLLNSGVKQEAHEEPGRELVLADSLSVAHFISVAYPRARIFRSTRAVSVDLLSEFIKRALCALLLT